MTNATTEILVVAFGGPTPGCCKRFDPCPGEAYCFVSGIFGDNPARKARVDEVTGHYLMLGGYSRFNELTEAQAAALTDELARRGRRVRVRCGYHHWAPHARDKVRELAAEGVERFVLLVMSPHQSSVSWDAYIRIAAEALAELPEPRPKISGIVEPFYKDAGFIEALTDHLRLAARNIGADFAADDTALLLSAHAVPLSIASTSPYVRQIEASAGLVQSALGARRMAIAYQSQPRDSRIPWTGPSIEHTIADLAKAGIKRVVAAPVGFLCDNVEVLYDLGIEGLEAARQHDLAFACAEAVNSHPAFIAALADRVEEKLGAVGM